uniref:Uncharacterized protein n=1 Tax=Anopheles culicifacies TaxID=139723 RepID=A0A182LRA4_9DIPT
MLLRTTLRAPMGSNSRELETRKTKSNNKPLPESHLKTTTTTVATTTTVEMLQAAPENLQKKDPDSPPAGSSGNAGNETTGIGYSIGFNATDSNGASSSLPVPLRTTTSMLATVVTILLIFTTTLL